MKKVTLHINNENESHIVELVDELSIGRSDAARLVLNDAGLSRLNTTIFRDGDEILIVDENSTNGTFVNNERIFGAPRPINDRDEIRIGNNTNIYVEFDRGQAQAVKPQATEVSKPLTIDRLPHLETSKPKENKQIPVVLIAAAGMFLFIIIGAVAAVLLIDNGGNKNTAPTGNTPRPLRSGMLIPIRVIDPLGGQDPDDLDDFIASWEVEEQTLNAADVDEIKVTSEKGTSDLKVTREFFEQQRNKALNHAGAGGAERAGLIPLPPQLIGGGVPKQKAKLAELIRNGKYKQPLDFADLAELRLNGTLVEMPWATNTYVLDVGGSASDAEFMSFEWDALGNRKSAPITPGSEKYRILQKLADNFDGQKYDLNNPRDRKQIRMRLLRMYNADSRKVFEEICKAYYEKFKVPLRVTSLTRSMDYQISLNAINSNSFRVSGKGSLPPHTSGCAFDMSRKNLSADEQNFMMTLLSTMEKNGKLDSLREGSDNACFHTFIYPDGIEPK